MNADPMWSCVMLVCGPLRYLVIPLPQYYSFRFYVELVHVREVVQIAEFYELTGISRYYFTCEIELDVCWMQLR